MMAIRRFGAAHRSRYAASGYLWGHSREAICRKRSPSTHIRQFRIRAVKPVWAKCLS
ncbi:MAG: hypothetical protein ACKO3I_09400 [Synechococcales cyanobacterium]